MNEDLSYNIIENLFKEVTDLNTEAYQKYFQFELLHNRTITNEKLFKMKISDTEICEICHRERDTIKHAFLECNKSAELWSQVENWTKAKISTSIKFTDIDKIFGYQHKKKIVDKIVLNTKIVIYNIRKTEKTNNNK